MSDILRNNDVELVSDDIINEEGEEVSSSIDDESSQNPSVVVDPIEVSDDTVRVPDGWTVDSNPDGGIPGEHHYDSPPVEKEPPAEPEYVDIVYKHRTIITNYSLSYLKSLADAGGVFYVVYTDGTENEVEYTEIFNPRESVTHTYTIEADAIAKATRQHFWSDDNGIHVTDDTQQAWKTGETNNFEDISDSKPYHNILMNSLGILLRRALNLLVSISKSGIVFYDGNGNQVNNILASFGRSGVQIGSNASKHLLMDENQTAVYNADGSLATFNALNIQTDHAAIGTINQSISDLSTIRSRANNALTSASDIYKTVVSGINTVAAPTDTVTESGDVQNTWTTKRPTYNPDYPVLFVATQGIKASGGYFCSTPMKDDTLTVIDGGHVTTGTIDASRIAVNQISVASLKDGTSYATTSTAIDGWQEIYISKSSDTTSVDAALTWITSILNVQNAWTTKHPTYDPNYPKLFVARQTRAINGTISCSTPVLDQSIASAISTAANDASAKATDALNSAKADASAKATDALNSAKADAAANYASKGESVSAWQIIYIAKQSGTVSISNPNYWVTESTDIYNTWTLKRPIYNSTYPVVYTSKQTKNVDGTITWTTPVKDDTTTIIDGGHITTGTIDAARVAVDQITVGSLQDGNRYAKIADLTGRNIALGTGEPKSKTMPAVEAGSFKTWDPYEVRNSYVKLGLTAGDKISISFDWSVVGAAENSTIKVGTNATPWEYFSKVATFTAGSSSGHVQKTVDITSGLVECTGTTVRFRIDAVDNNITTNMVITVSNLKLEVGEYSTEWSSAPEDAAAASKVASNFITATSNGIQVHNTIDTTNFVAIDSDSVDIVKNNNVVASFGETVQVGKSSKGYIEIGTNSNDTGYIDMYNSDILLCHIGYGAGINATNGTSYAPYYNMGKRKTGSTVGNFSFASGVDCTASAYASHAEGRKTTASGLNSHAEGEETTASSNDSHAEGYRTTARGTCSHAEGNETTASGHHSHAEGNETTASGTYSHAEGLYATASSYYSHAEGWTTTASGSASHAEGRETTASANASHAEGCCTTASENYSHAGGYYTIADKLCMTAIGLYNRSNIDNVLFVVGNGADSDSRRNAFTVIGAKGSTASAYVGGSTTSNGSAITSDARVKTLIDELNSDTSIEFIKQLQPKHYYKEDVEEYGFYAQEVEKIPEFGEVLVTKDNSGMFDLPDYRLLNYQGMIAPIVSVEQDLIARVEQLEAENKELKLQNEKLSKRLDNIERILAKINS